ncbi:ABC transporter ATP-binding protein [Lysinibacter sp. HNR]|uniref:ABC transporter ATP-binding protein n=1 Tax=Lysinibacter sp. HNR TaxID=3031408 RepID=UPI00243500CB|nr:ABC transporter ATP-binding protein [Lysinibacter sp. HNR]WGD36456.1 ABC transporter ATP-binding protein [Lysinibacter sp. HNR]
MSSLPPTAISLSHITKSFTTKRGPLSVIRDLSLEVDSGAFLSLIGPSGCGKSTLFTILAGLTGPDSGRVTLNGSTITDHRDSAKHCAYMPQDDVLFPWRSVIDNAIIGLQIQGVSRREARARAIELLPTFGLTDFAEAKPEHLSGGMRQRVSLLRTVLQGKKILLLDEPFAALDSLTRSDMQQWLSDVCRQLGVTVLLITHDIREAVYLSNRVVALAPRPTSIVADIIFDDIKQGQPINLRARAKDPDVMAAEHRLFDLLHSTQPDLG